MTIIPIANEALLGEAERRRFVPRIRRENPLSLLQVAPDGYGGFFEPHGSGQLSIEREEQMETSGGRTPATRDTGGGVAQRLMTETKQAFKTTEFWAYVALLIGLFIAGNSIEAEEGGSDTLDAGKVWLYATLLTIGYMISRGLAKSGSRDPYWGERGDH